LTVEEKSACEEYGKVAGNLAVDRKNGVPLSDQISAIKLRLGDTQLANEMRELAKTIYSNHPAFRSLSQEVAAVSFMMDCQTRIIKTKAGGKFYKSPEEIAAALDGFITYHDRPLIDLLGSYGIKIKSVETVPSDALGNGRPGDTDFTLTFSMGASKRMPCHLERWMRGETLPIVEFTRTSSEFPAINADQDDPLEYWAATGNCSRAYSY
jgi:hypothetical protein